MTMFLAYLKEFVQSFNTGKVPLIQTALEHLLESECFSTYEKALNIFDEELRNFQQENVNKEETEL